jgi:hypothetical protein
VIGSRENLVPGVIAAVVVVGLLCLVDLLLTFGVIRRLREHTDLLRDSQLPGGPPVTRLTAGQAPERFTAVTSDGGAVTGPDGLRLAGFFSAKCSACPERVAPFAAYVRTNGLAKDEVLAVLIVADGDRPPSYLSELAEVARVSVQPMDSMLAQAFGVVGYPAFCLLDAEGAVVSSGFDPAALPAPAIV